MIAIRHPKSAPRADASTSGPQSPAAARNPVTTRREPPVLASEPYRIRAAGRDRVAFATRIAIGDGPLMSARNASAASSTRLYSRMNPDSEQRISAKLAQIEADISMLREGYLVVNKRYAETLQTLKALTEHSLEASLRSATAAEKAALACRNATAAAVSSASENVIAAMQAAAEAAALAAVAASEAAAAASAAAAAAASAAAVQAEETALQASFEAARATTRATAAAAEAAKMAAEASMVARTLMQQARRP